MDGDRRYVMLRADVLMGIFREMEPELRRSAMEAFAASVSRYGGRSAQAYFDAADRQPERLLETIAGYSRELGWGRWRIDACNSETIDVTVDSSPFVEGFGSSPDPICHAIVGMLRAVGTIVLGRPVTAVETGCAAQQGIGRCTFRVIRATASTDGEAP